MKLKTVTPASTLNGTFQTVGNKTLPAIFGGRDGLLLCHPEGPSRMTLQTVTLATSLEGSPKTVGNKTLRVLLGDTAVDSHARQNTDQGKDRATASPGYQVPPVR